MNGLVVVALCLVAVTTLGYVLFWAGSEPRVAYRADRARLRRTRRRWARVRRGLSRARRQPEALVREVEHWLDLTRQALRARRRTTGLITFTRLLTEQQTERMETPFERAYLWEAQRTLDQIERQADASLAVVDETQLTRGGEPGHGALAEPA